MIVDPASSGTFPLRSLGTTAVCILLVATLFACTGGDEDSTRDEQALELEAKIQSLEESFEALADENVELRGEIAILGESLDDLDERLRELEEVTSKVESGFSLIRSSGPRTSGCRCRREPSWKEPSGWWRIPGARSTTSITPNGKTAQFW